MPNTWELSTDASSTRLSGVRSSSFSDGDHFNEAMRHADAEVVQTRAGRFQNRTLLVPLKDVVLRYGANEMPWLCSALTFPAHISLVLVTRALGVTYQNGCVTSGNFSFALHGSETEHFSRTAPGAHFYVPIPESLFYDTSRVLAGEDVSPRAHEFRHVETSEFRWQALVKIFEAIQAHARTEPDQFDEPALRAAMQRSLLSAAVLASAESREPSLRSAPGTTSRRHAALVRQVQAHLKEREGCPVYVLELCRVTGVSERTLREAFQENCGMGPMRYLKLRRLHEVHRILRDSSVQETSVKAAALDNGFWDLGRFAVEYRQLFGEPPLATLQGGTGKIQRVSPERLGHGPANVNAPGSRQGLERLPGPKVPADEASAPG